MVLPPLCQAALVPTAVAPAGLAEGDPGVCAPCPRLPSSSSALAFVKGEPGAIPRVARDWFFRGGLIFIGMSALGPPQPAGERFRAALAGSAAIEAFVLAYIGLSDNR